jgi:hypothetical protein
MTERIWTLHPCGKQGVHIERAKYDVIRAAILDVVQENPGITFTTLRDTVGDQLHDTFSGSISWYVTTVKLDLEARDEIERIPRTRPQGLRIVSG